MGRRTTQLMRLIKASSAGEDLSRDERLMRLDRLIACEAGTDAALELLAIVAPAWHLQRLCHDGGEWICTLCRRPRLPEWPDEVAEGRGASPALAVAAAMVETHPAGPAVSA